MSSHRSRALSILALPLSVLAFAACSAENTGGTGAESTDTARTKVVTEIQLGAPPEHGPGPGLHHGPPGGPELLLGAALAWTRPGDGALHAPLDLTAEQRATIEALARPHHPPFDPSRAKELAAAIRAGDLGALPKPPAPDLAARAKALQTLHDTLTPAQRAALVADVEARAPRHEPTKEGAKGPVRVERRIALPFGDDLGLTDAQKEQLEARFAASAPPPPDAAALAAMRSHMEEARLERKAKLESFKGERFDATAFVAPPAGAPHPELDRPRGNPLADLVSVLTPEQREKLAQKIEAGPPAR